MKRLRKYLWFKPQVTSLKPFKDGSRITSTDFNRFEFPDTDLILWRSRQGG